MGGCLLICSDVAPGRVWDWKVVDCDGGSEDWTQKEVVCTMEFGSSEDMR